MVVNTSVVNQTIWCNFRATRLYTILLTITMSSVIDKFEQELKKTNCIKYIQNGGDDPNEISRLSKRNQVLHKILKVMRRLKLSESTWNKFNHDEIEEIATSFHAVLEEFQSEADALYQTVQDWEDWADRRPY